MQPRLRFTSRDATSIQRVSSSTYYRATACQTPQHLALYNVTGRIKIGLSFQSFVSARRPCRPLYCPTYNLQSLQKAIHKLVDQGKQAVNICPRYMTNHLSINASIHGGLLPCIIYISLADDSYLVHGMIGAGNDVHRLSGSAACGHHPLCQRGRIIAHDVSAHCTNHHQCETCGVHL
jgi:hypothetical protein